MDTSGLLRHQMIARLAVPANEKAAEAAIAIWDQITTLVGAIVGTGGVDLLYARSLFLTQPYYAWLVVDEVPPQAPAQRFASLRRSYEGQTPDVIVAANTRLLCTFTDIVAALIGEALTYSILRSAWGDDAVVPTPKGFENE